MPYRNVHSVEGSICRSSTTVLLGMQWNTATDYKRRMHAKSDFHLFAYHPNCIMRSMLIFKEMQK